MASDIAVLQIKAKIEEALNKLRVFKNSLNSIGVVVHFVGEKADNAGQRLTSFGSAAKASASAHVANLGNAIKHASSRFSEFSASTGIASHALNNLEAATSKLSSKLAVLSGLVGGKLKNAWKLVTDAMLIADKELRSKSTDVGKLTILLEGLSNKLAFVGHSFRIVGIRLSILGAALTGLFVSTVKDGIEFQHTMSAVAAVTSATAEQFTLLSNKALELGRRTVFSASESAKAMEKMGLAGLTFKEILEGSEHVLSLASAGSLDIADAAQIATNVMRSFHISAENLGRVTDSLAVIASNANTDLTDLGEAFKYGAPLAASLGQRIEDVSIAFAVLANNGIRGSLAGTALSRALDNLISKGKDASKIFEKYGLTFEQVNPEVNNLIDIIRRFREANVSAVDVMDLLDVRGGRAMLSLMSAGSEVFSTLQDLIDNKFGTALRQSLIRLDNVHGRLEELRSVLETLSVKIFYSMVEALRSLIDSAIIATNKIVEWVNSNSKLAGVLALVVGAVGLLSTSLGILSFLVAPLITAAGTLTALFAKLVVAFYSYVEAAAASTAATATLSAEQLKILAIQKFLKESAEKATVSFNALSAAILGTTGSLTAYGAAANSAAKSSTLIAASGAAIAAPSRSLITISSLLKQGATHVIKFANDMRIAFGLTGRAAITFGATIFSVVTGILVLIASIAKSWNGISKAVKSGYDKFIRPVWEGIRDVIAISGAWLANTIDRIAASISGISEEFQSLAGESETLSNVLYLLGVAFGGLSFLVNVVAEGVYAVVLAFEFLARGVIISINALFKFYDLIKERSSFLKTFGEGIRLITGFFASLIRKTAGLTEEVKAGTKALEYFNKIQEDVISTTGRLVSEDSEYLDLMKRFNSLTPNELSRLAALKRAREDANYALTKTREIIEGQISALKERMEVSDKDSEAYKIAAVSLKILNEMLSQTRKNIESNLEIEKELPKVYRMSAEEIDNVAKSTGRRAKIQERYIEIAKEAKNVEKELADLRKEISELNQTSIEREIASLIKLEDSLESINTLKRESISSEFDNLAEQQKLRKKELEEYKRTEAVLSREGKDTDRIKATIKEVETIFANTEKQMNNLVDQAVSADKKHKDDLFFLHKKRVELFKKEVKELKDLDDLKEFERDFGEAALKRIEELTHRSTELKRKMGDPGLFPEDFGKSLANQIEQQEKLIKDIEAAGKRVSQFDKDRLADLIAQKGELQNQKDILDLMIELWKEHQALVQADIERRRKEFIAEERKKISELEKKQKDALREDAIERAKASKDYKKLAELETEKFIEEREKQKEELFKDLKFMTEEEKKRFEERKKLFEKETQLRAKELRESILARALEKEKQQKSEIATLEEKALDNLVKQVDTVRELFILFRALFNLREMQEEKSLKAALKALRLHEAMERQAAAFAKSGTKEDLKLFRKLKLLADTQMAIAEKRYREFDIRANIRDIPEPKKQPPPAQKPPFDERPAVAKKPPPDDRPAVAPKPRPDDGPAVAPKPRLDRQPDAAPEVPEEPDEDKHVPRIPDRGIFLASVADTGAEIILALKDEFSKLTSFLGDQFAAVIFGLAEIIEGLYHQRYATGKSRSDKLKEEFLKYQSAVKGEEGDIEEKQVVVKDAPSDIDTSSPFMEILKILVGVESRIAESSELTRKFILSQEAAARAEQAARVPKDPSLQILSDVLQTLAKIEADISEESSDIRRIKLLKEAESQEKLAEIEPNNINAEITSQLLRVLARVEQKLEFQQDLKMPADLIMGLSDLGDKISKGFGFDADRIIASIQKGFGSLDFSNLNLSRIPPADKIISPLDAGEFRRVHEVKQLTDNRAVSIEVNNNVDLNNLVRQVRNAFADSLQTGVIK